MTIFKDQRTILLIIVYIGLFLDYILFSVVVPILPEYLLRIEHPNETEFLLNNKAHNATDEQLTRRHDLIEESGVHFSILFGTKACLQLVTNPIVGIVTNRIGSSLPLFLGFLIMTGSTILFALGTNFPVLLIARSLQGVGSACTATAGMALLAKVYTDEIERSRAMGIALGAIAFGDMVGPPYGGTLYHLAGKELPFLLLAVLGAIGGIIQLIVLPPKVEKNQADEEPSSMKDLLLDPYVVITLSGVFFTYLGWSAMESVMPVWLIDHFGANSIQRGLIYLPASLMYLFGTNFFGPVTYKLGRWLAAFVGLLLLSVAQFAVTIMPGLYWLAIPFVMLGMMISIVDTSLYPMLSYLVEIRHQNVFGSIYAMADAVYCLSNVIGPFAAAKIVTYVGFSHTTQIAALITLLASPLMLFLRNPPVKNKKKMPTIGATVFPKSVSSKDIIHKDKDIALHEIDLK